MSKLSPVKALVCFHYRLGIGEECNLFYSINCDLLVISTVDPTVEGASIIAKDSLGDSGNSGGNGSNELSSSKSSQGGSLVRPPDIRTTKVLLIASFTQNFTSCPVNKSVY